MNKQLLIIYFILLTATTANAQVESMQYRLAGIIHSSDASEKTPFVHIINLRTGTGTISDSLGIFRIKLLKTDTLLFRCIGFEDKIMTLPDSLKSTICFLEISLSPTSYQLNVVDIFALTRENQFRYDFIRLKPDKNAWGLQMIIPGVTRSEYQFMREEEKFNPKQTFDGPISALYFMFSDKGKSLRKLGELLLEDEMELMIYEKYNKAELGKFSGFSGAKLDSLYNYLAFSNNYLLEATTYEIFVEVQKRMVEFDSTYSTSNKP